MNDEVRAIEELEARIDWQQEYFDLRDIVQMAFEQQSPEKMRKILAKGLVFSADIARYMLAILDQLDGESMQEIEENKSP